METKQFDEYFEVSDTGAVFSLPRIINGRRYQGKRLTPRFSGKALQVHCRLSTGEDKFLQVDRLVYSTFTGKKLKSDDAVIHLDGDPYNCNLSNLVLAAKLHNESGRYQYKITDIEVK